MAPWKEKPLWEDKRLMLKNYKKIPRKAAMRLARILQAYIRSLGNKQMLKIYREGQHDVVIYICCKPNPGNISAYVAVPEMVAVV